MLFGRTGKGKVLKLVLTWQLMRLSPCALRNLDGHAFVGLVTCKHSARVASRFVWVVCAQLKAMQRRNALAALHSAKVRAALGVARDVCNPVPVCTRSLAAVSGAVCRGVGEWTPGRVWRH